MLIFAILAVINVRTMSERHYINTKYNIIKSCPSFSAEFYYLQAYSNTCEYIECAAWRVSRRVSRRKLQPSNTRWHHHVHSTTSQGVRDWSLITGRGGLQNGKIAGPKLFAPPPQDRVKLFAPPLLKCGTVLCPPTIWLKHQATT